ncbi:hypothetical protein PO878_15205 [Iamia majanohamensis]|uniref:Asparagine synthase n=1 Tax=Iamia majanohamensis TaxID=467976 RepID=A0AAE9Y4D0_9ACTN|nr:hypothetical protein [Iamia majanohamensis]WCO65850.1 hypothetical protein PO878_15205 [Iamia majanohamensis]
MQLARTVDGGLPPLAWCVRVTAGRADAVHGPAVVSRPDLLHDGAWAGPVAEGRPDQVLSCGSGVVRRGDVLRVVTPEVPFDRVHLVEADGALHLSNSLPFLLAATDDALDPEHLWYRSRMRAVEHGTRLAPTHIPTRRGRRVRVLLGDLADITDDGTVRVRHRPLASPVRDFADLRQRLSTTVAAVVANAGDEDRPSPLRPLVTMSSGYDATAAAVLAAEAGVSEAVTMLRRDEDGSLLDHPATAARVLGLDLVEVERDRWRHRTDLPEAELAATATSLMDVTTLTLEDHLPGRLLIVGYCGDNVWSTTNHRTAPDVVQGYGDLSGRGLAEHRLRVGYAVLAPAAIDHTAHPSMLRLARSAEMAPWRVGGRYDRPVPRRIAEDAGVPRGEFATRKLAGSGRVGSSRQAYPRADVDRVGRDLEEVLTPAGVASYTAHLRTVDVGSAQRAMRVGGALWWAYHRLDAVDHRVGARLERLGVRGLVPRRAKARMARWAHVHPDLTAWWPHWGVEVLRGRYRGRAPG